MHVALLVVLLTVPPVPPQAPDPCKLLTLEDVTAALGPGYSAAPAAAAGKAESGQGPRCIYQKDDINLVSLTIVQAQNGDAKLVLNERRAGYEKRNRGVLEAPGTCPAAFIVALSSTNAIFMGAKGGWNTELQVMVDGKSDAAVERSLGRTVCGRIP